jgi:transcriptional regulator with XRE-family HTH domain
MRRETITIKDLYGGNIPNERKLEIEKKSLMKQISMVLEEYRYDNKYSQKQLASVLGVSQPMVSKLESGTQNISVVKLLEVINKIGGEIDIRISFDSSFRIEEEYFNVDPDIKPIQFSFHQGLQKENIDPLKIKKELKRAYGKEIIENYNLKQEADDKMASKTFDGLNNCHLSIAS